MEKEILEILKEIRREIADIRCYIDVKKAEVLEKENAKSFAKFNFNEIWQKAVDYLR